MNPGQITARKPCHVLQLRLLQVDCHLCERCGDYLENKTHHTYKLVFAGPMATWDRLSRPNDLIVTTISHQTQESTAPLQSKTQKKKTSLDLVAGSKLENTGILLSPPGTLGGNGSTLSAADTNSSALFVAQPMALRFGGKETIHARCSHLRYPDGTQRQQRGNRNVSGEATAIET